MFFPEIHANLSRCKEKRSHCRLTRYKNLYLFAAILRPVCPGAKILTY